MKNEKTVLLHFQKHAYEGEISRCNHFIQSHLQPLVNLYYKAGMGKLQSNEIVPLVEDPKGFLVGKITGGKDLQFMGLKLSKVKANELVQFSEEQEYVIEAAKAITIAVKDGSVRGGFAPDLKNYEVSGQTVKVSEKASNDLKEIYTVYTESEKEVFLFYKLTAIKDIMNEIQTKTGMHINLDRFSDDAFNQLNSGSPKEVNWEFIKQ